MKKMSKAIFVMANTLAILGMCSACMFLWFQPELPEKNKSK